MKIVAQRIFTGVNSAEADRGEGGVYVSPSLWLYVYVCLSLCRCIFACRPESVFFGIVLYVSISFLSFCFKLACKEKIINN